MDKKNEVKKTEKQSSKYSLSFKRQVVEEYLCTGVSKMSLLRKYDIKFKSAIQKWLKLFELQDKWIINKALQINSDISKDLKADQPLETDIASLQQRIKELEKALLEGEIRLYAANRTIEIAEEELKIPIRKKHNTK